MNDVPDREIMKRIIKWRTEANLRDRAKQVPQFKSLSEIEERIVKSYEAEMEHYEYGS